MFLESDEDLDVTLFTFANTLLEQFHQTTPNFRTQNFGVAISLQFARAGLYENVAAVGDSKDGAVSSATLQHEVCDIVWGKSPSHAGAVDSVRVLKPFSTALKEPSGNNWRNSFDLQSGLGCDAPADSDFLLSESFLGESRVSCTFRSEGGACHAPRLNPDKVPTCFNPAKSSGFSGTQSNARLQTPKLLGRSDVTQSRNELWRLPLVLDSADALLGVDGQRVPVYPFAYALYSGSVLTPSREGEALELRLQVDMAVSEEVFFTLFDFDPLNVWNAAFLEMFEAPAIVSDLSPAPQTPISSGGPEGGGIEFLPRDPADLRVMASAESDPVKRANLLERAVRGHQATLNALAGWLGSRGYVLREQPGGYDLAAVTPGGEAFLFEVKTWRGGNLAKQVRSGWAQLYEYRFRSGPEFSSIGALYLVLDSAPPADSWAWAWLADELAVVPCWIEGNELVTFERDRLLLPADLSI